MSKLTPLHLAADKTRLARIWALGMGGRKLAMQKAIVRTMRRGSA